MVAIPSKTEAYTVLYFAVEEPMLYVLSTSGMTPVLLNLNGTIPPVTIPTSPDAVLPVPVPTAKPVPASFVASIKFDLIHAELKRL